VDSETLDAWGLEPRNPNWATGFPDEWTPGEAGAQAALDTFIDGPLAGYSDDRNRPDLASTSRLSPHLRFGEISPLQIWHRVQMAAGMDGGRDVAKFLAEVGWREFSYHLLFHWPDLAESSFQSRFDAFPWHDDAAMLSAWQRGQTGNPIVDAGKRQLWRTGWMHNRVRMVVASFLVKHLRIDWRAGERWFWDTLVDADPANNPASWQWVAGSGADAAPYFRIFNPMLQGTKFDPQGAYVRRWVPELAGLPDEAIHAPWQASRPVLDRAGVRLGETYPHPIVDHDAARGAALAALAATREPTHA
ncbi:MAG: deoxyribodipyrimidine photo-lyase, partial [Phreatobacter sp.]|nr:deoxyribodipyrimidine photo-lyase [Phreatobacter sp.]